MGYKNKIANDITNLIKEFTEKHCSNCESYVFLWWRDDFKL